MLFSPYVQLYPTKQQSLGCAIFSEALLRSQRHLENDIFRLGGQKYIEEIGTKLVPSVKYFQSSASAAQVIHQFRADFERCWNSVTESPSFREFW